MARYWNGYRWVDDPPMARAERAALIDVEPTEAERAALRYWNGYRWVDDPPMARAEPREPTEAERAALIDAELRPRTKTDEHSPVVEVEIETSQVEYSDEDLARGFPDE